MINQNDPRFKHLCEMVWQCWGSIGSDLEQAVAESGEQWTNAGAVEACLDADRLMVYPGGPEGKAANDYVRSMAEAGHYRELARAVEHRCRLA